MADERCSIRTPRRTKLLFSCKNNICRMRIHAALWQMHRDLIGARRRLRASSNFWPSYWRYYCESSFKTVGTCALQQVVTVNPHFTESLKNHQRNCLDSKASFVFNFMWKMAIVGSSSWLQSDLNISLCYILCWKLFPVHPVFSVRRIRYHCFCCDCQFSS